MQKSKTYEINLWLKPEASPALAGSYPEQEESGALRALKEEIAKLGGEIVKEWRFLKRRLAYPIDKETEGYFGTLLVRLLPHVIPSLHERVKHESSVLRLGVFEKEEKGPLTMRAFRRAPRKVAPKETAPQPVDLEGLDKKLEEILKA